MKLYILPVEKACDAKCGFCITNFRETSGKEFISLEKLAAPFVVLRPEKIEITGGGEPTLHPQINEVISYCSSQAPTIMYTHGAHIERVSKVDDLSELCVSVAHYDPEENKRIMGVNPNFDALRRVEVPIKFSLMLHNSGINDREGVLNYLAWASQFAGKVVVRQMFEHDYQGSLEGEFVSSERIFEELGVRDFRLTKQENPVFTRNGLEVEVEYRSCACEMDNPVLHADGRLHKGWSEVQYDPYR